MSFRQDQHTFDLFQGLSEHELIRALGERGITGDTKLEIFNLFNKIEDQQLESNPNVILEGMGRVLQVVVLGEVSETGGIAGSICPSMNKSTYAVIKHNKWKRFRTGTKIDGKDLYLCSLHASSYYIAGINDEGKYFLRPLNLLPAELLESLKLPDILDWLNRRDQGFRRLQGDLLVRFYPIEGNRLNDKEMGKGFRYRIPDVFEGQLTHEYFARLHSGLSDIIQPGVSANSLGDHSIIVETNANVSRAFPNFTLQEPLIVDGEKIVLSHPQHASVTLEIPKGHYVAICSQRGRTPIDIRQIHMD